MRDRRHEIKSFVLVAVLAWTAAATAGAAEESEPAHPELWKGKDQDSGRILHEQVVDAPPSMVFELWTTREGVRKFLAPEARIDPEVGGRYEIIFDPDDDPDGTREGTKGARILRYDPPHELAFEWKGRWYMKEMNVKPLPTWVELEFVPLPENDQRTRVRLIHYGFRSGHTWDYAYVFFDNVWRSVLARLRNYCAARERPLVTSLPAPPRVSHVHELGDERLGENMITRFG